MSARRLSRLGVVAVVLFLTAACAGGETATLAREFQVNFVSPAAGSVVENPRAEVLVVCSLPIDASTVHGSSVWLRSLDGLPVRGSARVARFSPVTIAFLPAVDLQRGVTYEIVVSTSVRDVLGHALPIEYRAQFAMSGKPRPSTPSGGGAGPNPIPIKKGDLFYVEDCTPSAGGTGPPCNSAGPAELSLGGRVFPFSNSGTPDLRSTAPSPKLHQGARVFLSVQSGSGSTPDGSSNQVLIAVMPSRGSEVTIVGGSPAVGIHSPRWAKDETFLSYTALEWNGGAGLPACRIYKVPVTWGSDGMPIPGAATVALAKSSFFVNGAVESPIRDHDWSPDGTGLVYVEVAPTGGSIPTADAVKVLNGGKTISLASGGTMRWPCWEPGSGNRIAFTTDDGKLSDIYVCTPDRSVCHGVFPYVFIRYGIAWSPQGGEIAGLRAKEVQVSGKTVELLGLFVFPVIEGNQQDLSREITAPDEGVLTLFGWLSQTEH